MIAFLQALNSMTPLGLAALLALVLWRQAGHTKQIRNIKENDLHEIGEILAVLQRIERDQAAAFATIIARLNGK